MEQVREAIRQDRLGDFREEFFENTALMGQMQKTFKLDE